MMLFTGEEPYFIEKLEPKSLVKEGSILVLKCKAMGNPKPKIEWYHDKRLIRDSRYFKIKHFDEIGLSQLTIFEIFKDDEGKIKAIAENKWGKTETEADIQVEGKLETKPKEIIIII